jgi:hypothetical protein
LIEINPPLVIWLNLPAVALAHSIGLDPVVIFRVGLAGLVLISGLTTYALLPTSGAPVLLAFVLTLLPASHTGQREHIAVALLLPLLALAARRSTGRTVSPGLALAVGIAAGVGIALKPFLVPVWLAVVFYRRLAREDVAIACVGLAYVLAVIMLTPQYVPLVRQLAPQYNVFGHESTVTIMAALPSIAILTLGLAWLYTRSPSPAADVGFLASGGAVVAVLLQQKGWEYHWLPAISFAVLALPSAIHASNRRAAVLTASLLLAWSVGREIWFGQKERQERIEQTALVQRLARGHDRMLMLTSDFLDVWPSVGERWAGSLPCMWWTSSPLTNTPAERLLLEYVRRDLAQHPPIVLVETLDRHYRTTNNLHHPLAMLGPLEGYRMVDSAGGFTAWVRDSS